MKIGIITLPLKENYGGILQAYALQEYLIRLGHDVYHIDRDVTIPKKSVSKRVKYIVKYILGRTENQIRKKILCDTNLFIRTKIRKTDKITDNDGFYRLDKYDFDAVIVGSDQVWRYEYSGNRYFNYFLDFVQKPDIKKMAYAASFGLDTWTAPQDVQNKVKELVKSFDSISVREQSGIVICKDMLDVDANQMIDPTLLFNSGFYNKLINEDNNQRIGLLTYILDNTEDKQIAINILERELQLKRFTIGLDCSYQEAINQRLKYPSIESWIAGFKNADYVITDSFHGCLFSIIYNKQFVVYGNHERGMSRFLSVLEMLNLTDRIIYNSDEVDKAFRGQINYDEINELLKFKRTEVLEYFNKNI